MERNGKDGAIHEERVLPLPASLVDGVELNTDLAASVKPVAEPKPVSWRPWMRNPQNPM